MNAFNPSETSSRKPRYLLFVTGRWRWRPTKKMREAGFRLITFGREMTPENYKRVIELNDDWDQHRHGTPKAPRVAFPPGTVGEAYFRIMTVRQKLRREAGRDKTSEERSRDDWPRAWKHIGKVWADCSPRTITFEMMDAFRERLRDKHSTGEAFRTIKVWRTLWKKMAVLGYCDLERDPSLLTANSAPEARSASWIDHEVKILVQRAWRRGYHGLAALMAVAWDSQLSPVDCRNLTPADRIDDRLGTYFEVDRAKTGRAAAATLSQWSKAILDAYLAQQASAARDSAPIFRTRYIPPTVKGGRTWLPRPYTKDKLGKDFRAIRDDAFGGGEARQLADMRRSGTIEAFAGGAEPSKVAAKMANTLAASNQLQKVYNPVHVASVRLVDAARVVGRARIREQCR